MIDVYNEDVLECLRTRYDRDSFHAVVTDPPYGLSNPSPARITAAIQEWAVGNREHVPDGKGFMGRSWDAFVPPPAVWDECYRVLKPGGHMAVFAGARSFDLMALSIRMAGFEIRDTVAAWLYGQGFPKSKNIEDGWGTALKPAWEPIILARKLLDGTVAENVMEHGTGAMNIDGCRIESEPYPINRLEEWSGFGEKERPQYTQTTNQGRWPTNAVLVHHPECDDDCAEDCQVRALGGQSGYLPGGAHPGVRNSDKTRNAYGHFNGQDNLIGRRTDSGTASRFFPTFRYQAKAGAAERPKVDGKGHPTVKPLELMRWLVTLLVPEGGKVLDPFAGSGSTLLAAEQEGMNSVGIELDEHAREVLRAKVGV